MLMLGKTGCTAGHGSSLFDGIPGLMIIGLHTRTPLVAGRRFANATFSELKPREISSAAAAKGITAVKGVGGDLFGGSSARLFLRGRLGALRRRRLPLWCDGDPVEQVQVDFIGHKHGMSLH